MGTSHKILKNTHHFFSFALLFDSMIHGLNFYLELFWAFILKAGFAVLRQEVRYEEIPKGTF